MGAAIKNTGHLGRRFLAAVSLALSSRQATQATNEPVTTVQVHKNDVIILSPYIGLHSNHGV